MLKKTTLALGGAALFLAWNGLLLLLLWGRPAAPPGPQSPRERAGGSRLLPAQLLQLAQDAEAELRLQRELLLQIQRFSHERRQNLRGFGQNRQEFGQNLQGRGQNPQGFGQNLQEQRQNQQGRGQNLQEFGQNFQERGQIQQGGHQNLQGRGQNQQEFGQNHQERGQNFQEFGQNQQGGRQNQEHHQNQQERRQNLQDLHQTHQERRQNEQELHQNEHKLHQNQAQPPKSLPSAAPSADPEVIPVLVLACDRSSVRRCLDKLLLYRPSARRFPVIVSQDCGHAETARVIASYGRAVAHIRQPDLSEVPVPPEHRKFQGYYKISRHYRWALGQVFGAFRYRAAIVVEDDLEVAPDFFEYFQAVLPLLRGDPTLWCASAWNDNGREALVDAGGAELLYRTDFFPGLGWLLLAELWEELEPKWPAAFWDDWMRQPEQRRGRSCVRPEVSRTMTFGRKGVSHGQFFDQYLKFIKLNDRFVPFTRMDLSYLKKDEYERSFLQQVYSAPEVQLEELQKDGGKGSGPVRLQYRGRDSFKALAKALGLMDDLKSGVPRAGYRGVVSFMCRGRRVFLAPPSDWTGYDPSWS